MRFVAMLVNDPLTGKNRGTGDKFLGALEVRNVEHLAIQLDNARISSRLKGCDQPIGRR
mgnify:CR=1 FL=1